MLLYRVLKEAFSASWRRVAPAISNDTDNPLMAWYLNHTGRLVHKWIHYFEIYHRHFSRYRGKSPIVLEIGVFHGGSLEMWHDYFGPGCSVFGIDADPRCKSLEGEGTKILIGDQADRSFLARVRSELPIIDILIDDGGHKMEQQIATLEELYSHIAKDGIYLCEDLHTSYWSEFGGGYHKSDSFIEYSKALIDQLNAWYSREPERFHVNDFTQTTYSMHYYDSVLVIEKRPMQQPTVGARGHASF